MFLPSSPFSCPFKAPVRISPDNPLRQQQPLIGAARFVSHRLTLKIAAIGLLSSLAVPAIYGANGQPGNPKSPPGEFSKQYLAMPMQFEPNQGQTDPRVQFLSRGPGYTLFLTPTQAVISLRSMDHLPGERKSIRQRRDLEHRQIAQTAMHMNLLGANASSTLETIGDQAGSANYFIGNKPADWHTEIPLFAKVKYHEVYSGIDLVYYGNHRQLEYDFIVSPHADARQISIDLAGTQSLEIDSDGDLIARLDGGSVRWHKPFAYQETSNGRQEVRAAYVLKGPSTIAFAVSDYDRTVPLIIDPALVYATYLGGSDYDFVCGIGLDSSGNIYLAGNTASLNFPTQSAFRTNSAGSNDVFVSKFNNNGTALIFSTYLGGSGNELANGMAIDSSGNTYVTGVTDSGNFPTRNAAYSSSAGFNEAYIAKIGPFGTNLLYASYLGGNGDDSGNAVAVDNSGHAYLTGDTFSVGTGNGPFPIKPNNAYQTHSGGGRDAFVAEFDTTLTGSSSLVYSTFLGGSTDEKAYGIAVDASGNAYIVGVIYSYPNFPNPPTSDFPILNAFQPSFNQGNPDPLAGNSDAFLTKLNATGTGLIFSTFLGGGDEDMATGVTLGASGRIYVIGETASTNFPVVNAAQSFISGAEGGFPPPDAFITVFQSAGTSLYYSTYLGGSGYESGFTVYHFGIAVDGFGDIYTAGYTDSLDFPLTTGADNTNFLGGSDAFVVKINPAVPGPAGIVYSTLLGGDDNDRATGIAVDPAGNFYVAGFTTSTTNLATPGAFRGTNSGGSDVFLAKFTSPPDISVSMVPSLEPVIVGSNVTYSIYVNNNGRSTFTGVTNTVQFPPNIPILSISSSAGNWSSNSGQVVFNLGTLTNNASVLQSITIHTLAPGVLTNVATLSSFETASAEPNTDNNVDVVLTTVRGIADVTLTASGAPDPVTVTSNLTYTFKVTNKGPYPATQVELTSLLPTNVNFVSATNTQGGCTNFDGFIVCDFGVITNNTSATITLVATALSPGPIPNPVAVTAFELDLNPANNLASLTNTALPLADLSLNQTSPAAGYAGSNITYTLSVSNAGPNASPSTVVTDTLPPGAVFVSATTSRGSFSQTNGIVTFSLGTITSNGIANLTVIAKSIIAGPNTNNVSLTFAGTDPILSNNSASLVTTIIAAADLGVSQIASPTSTPLTSNVTFTVTATNRGPSTAAAVILSNTVAAAFSIVSIQSPPGASCSQNGNTITCSLGSMTNGAAAILSVLAQANITGTFTNSATVTSTTADLNPNNTATATVTVTPSSGAILLQITRTGAQVIFSWSTNATGYSLQSNPTLSTGGAWSPVTNVPVQIGNQFFVTNNIGATNNFYRLIR